MTWTNYDSLRVRLIDILRGDEVLLPSWDHYERYDPQIAFAVSEVTRITPEHWARLDPPFREPWLEKTIRLLTKQQLPADPENGSRVVLRDRADRPIVLGKPKKKITTAQYDVVKALLDAGDKSLTID